MRKKVFLIIILCLFLTSCGKKEDIQYEIDKESLNNMMSNKEDESEVSPNNINVEYMEEKSNVEMLEINSSFDIEDFTYSFFVNDNILYLRLKYSSIELVKHAETLGDIYLVKYENNNILLIEYEDEEKVLQVDFSSNTPNINEIIDGNIISFIETPSLGPIFEIEKENYIIDSFLFIDEYGFNENEFTKLNEISYIDNKVTNENGQIFYKQLILKKNIDLIVDEYILSLGIGASISPTKYDFGNNTLYFETINGYDGKFELERDGSSFYIKGIDVNDIFDVLLVGDTI